MQNLYLDCFFCEAIEYRVDNRQVKVLRANPTQFVVVKLITKFPQQRTVENAFLEFFLLYHLYWFLFYFLECQEESV